MKNIIHAPFNPEQVNTLRIYQTDPRFYPMQCGKGCFGPLVPQKDGSGMLCPACRRLQSWVPYAVFMLGGYYPLPSN